MSTSTDAIMAFGIDLGAQEDFPDGFMGNDEEEDSLDSEEVLLRAFSLQLPDLEEDYAAYYKAKKEALSAIPLTLIHHCSGRLSYVLFGGARHRITCV
jgi:hypothetical protein